nr:MAG TPA: hypothetical protein [Caudoviricetes sp.]
MTGKIFLSRLVASWRTAGRNHYPEWGKKIIISQSRLV